MTMNLASVDVKQLPPVITEVELHPEAVVVDGGDGGGDDDCGHCYCHDWRLLVVTEAGKYLDKEPKKADQL